MSLLVLCGSLAAQDVKAVKMYKWTDENGTVHYSAKPAEQAQAEEVAIRPGPKVAGGVVAPVADPEQVKYCEQVRKNVELLSSDASDLEIMDNGKLRPMTPEEREPQLQANRGALERCKGVPAPPPPPPPR